MAEPSDGRVLRCVRDDAMVGAGVDVQVFDGDGLMVSQRCVDRAGALFVAEAWRQENVRGG